MENLNLYSYLKEHDFYLNEGQFRHCTGLYGKEVFRETIAKYVEQQRPPFPYRDIPYDDMVNNFRKLQKADYSKFITPVEK